MSFMYHLLIHDKTSEVPTMQAAGVPNMIRVRPGVGYRHHGTSAWRRDGIAMCRRELVELAGELSERDGAETLDQQRLGIAHGTGDGVIDDLLDQAIRALAIRADREDPRTTDGTMHIQQRHAIEVTGQLPPAVMTFQRLHIPVLAQPAHRAPDHGGIGAQHDPDLFRRDGAILASHMQQDMQHS